jgi:endo-beta-N-acetylglucosaminidase D
VSYQNALTPYNLPFAEACGSILTNYCWDESQAADSKLYAVRSGFKTEKVYFGIDVFAQGGGRITYPKERGGGTNTGVAVAKLADMGMSAGLFAPAWSFEHFHNHGSEIEKVIWEGDTLPVGVICPCKDITKCHQPIVGFSVFEHARAFPAGSDTFCT